MIKDLNGIIYFDYHVLIDRFHIVETTATKLMPRAVAHLVRAVNRNSVATTVAVFLRAKSATVFYSAPTALTNLSAPSAPATKACDNVMMVPASPSTNGVTESVTVLVQVMNCTAPTIPTEDPVLLSNLNAVIPSAFRANSYVTEVSPF